MDASASSKETKMVDINELLGLKPEPEATPEVTPEVKPVATPAAAPVVAAPVAVKAGGDDFEVLPGIWSISLSITHAFTLPDGTWVRPTQDGNGTRAAVPAKWVEYVRSL
jgi:hypothetical protein